MTQHAKIGKLYGNLYNSALPLFGRVLVTVDTTRTFAQAYDLL